MNKYNLSKDYEKLYNLILDGSIIAGYVDYQFASLVGKCEPSRDVCNIKKIDKTIIIGARGIQYGGVDNYEIKHFKKSEKELFIIDCNRMNLEFIDIAD